MHYTRGESGKETLWLQTLKTWRRWTHQNSTPEGSMHRKCQRHKEVETPLQEDSTRDDEEAENDFWTFTGEFIYRRHFVPRVKLYMPPEETYLVPLKYIDVTRNTRTSLDVLLEKSIGDFSNVDGDRDCQIRGSDSQDLQC